MTRSRPLPATLSMCLLALAGCNLNSGIDGNGNVTEVAADPALLDGIDRVELQSSANVTILIDPDAEPSIRVTTDENLHEFIELKSVNGRLSINTQGSIDPSDGVQVAIVARSLAGVVLSGSGEVSVVGIEGDRFEATVAGSGDVTLNGQATVVELTVSGSGEIEAGDLTASDVVATVSGSGDIELQASQSVQATVSGSGEIEVDGSPTNVNQTVTGSGAVKVN